MVSGHEDDTDEELPISKYHQQNTSSTIVAENKYSIQTAIHETPMFITPKRRRLIDDPLFFASLDRTKTTPREAMYIVAPALKAVGIDVDDMKIPTSSIYRARKTVRKSVAQTNRKHFVPNTPQMSISIENYYRTLMGPWWTGCQLLYQA